LTRKLFTFNRGKKQSIIPALKENNEMVGENDKIIDTINLVLDGSHLSRLSNVKARTHGGEWSGPCPMCKRDGNGNGGSDRLRVWPLRPLEGNGSREEPVFWCRQCNKSGDLAQFVQYALGVAYGEARHYLGLANGYAPSKPRPFTPTVSETGAPFQEWQGKAFAFIRECVECLWGPDGVHARKYLMEERGLRETTLRAWQVGWQPDKDRWDDPADWGLEPGSSRVRIFRGMVFPELHRSEYDGFECWSISIRRPPKDLEDEFFETGKPPAKYPAIRGSQKALLGTLTIKRGRPLLLTEGHLDVLTAWQEARDLVSVCATQSVSGARDPRSVGFWLPQASGVILCFDPDKAGESASNFWDDSLPCRIRHTPIGGDLNSMLVRGEDVRAFVSRGIRKLHAVYPDLQPQPTPQDDQEALQTVVDLPDTTCEETGPFSAHLEAPVSDDLDTLWERGCEICHGEVVEFLEHDGEVRGYCQDHLPVCYCGGKAVVVDYLWAGWCSVHIAGFQLIERGRKIGYPPLYVPRGESFVPGVGGSEYVSARVWEAECGGGVNGYRHFIANAHPAQVWCAALDVSAQGIGCQAIRRPKVKRLCSNWHCQRDVDRPRVIEFPNTDWQKKDDKKEKKKDPIIVRGQTTIVNETRYGWCPYCTDAAFVLALAEELHWMAWQGGTQVECVGAGVDAWIEFCRNSEPFHITLVFDIMRKKYQKEWIAVQEFLV
jgi:hypothetical protein